MSEKFSKSNFLLVSKKVIEFQLKTLYPIKFTDDADRVYQVLLSHDRNFSTFLTILDSVKNGRVVDVYTLSRSMFESVINMGLLSKSLIDNDILLSAGGLYFQNNFFRFRFSPYFRNNIQYL